MYLNHDQKHIVRHIFMWNDPSFLSWVGLSDQLTVDFWTSLTGFWLWTTITMEKIGAVKTTLNERYFEFYRQNFMVFSVFCSVFFFFFFSYVLVASNTEGKDFNVLFTYIHIKNFKLFYMKLFGKLQVINTIVVQSEWSSSLSTELLESVNI